MRSRFNNTKGYALIMVLLIIVIIAIMTPPIVARIMTSSSQFQLVEEKLQIEKLQEMGVQYMEKSISIAIDYTNKSVESEKLTPVIAAAKFEGKLRELIPSNQMEVLVKDASYKYELSYTNPKPKDDTNEEWIIYYKINVTVNNKSKEFIPKPIEIPIKVGG